MRRLRGMIFDQWLIVCVATLTIAFVLWLAFMAIAWRAEAEFQRRSSESLSSFITTHLPEALKAYGTYGDNRSGPDQRP